MKGFPEEFCQRGIMTDLMTDLVLSGFRQFRRPGKDFRGGVCSIWRVYAQFHDFWPLLTTLFDHFSFLSKERFSLRPPASIIYGIINKCGFEDFAQIKDCMKGFLNRFRQEVSLLTTFMTLSINFVASLTAFDSFHCPRVPFWPEEQRGNNSVN